ncbi:MAG TPA: DUF6233 domain-containing protein [Kofleriaceae bacterium]|nr:DUF6233 domain-containing protein [Kofleriaceae bacterium]
MIEPSAEERLTALRLLRRVQVDDLARTDRWIAQAEQQLADQQKPKPPPEPTRAPLPRPPYVTQTRHGRPPILHGPDCWVRDDGIGTLAIDADSAREGLAGAVIEACDVCTPEAELGMP